MFCEFKDCGLYYREDGQWHWVAPVTQGILERGKLQGEIKGDLVAYFGAELGTWIMPSGGVWHKFADDK